jgi:hypothetical protein
LANAAVERLSVWSMFLTCLNGMSFFMVIF